MNRIIGSALIGLLLATGSAWAGPRKDGSGKEGSGRLTLRIHGDRLEWYVEGEPDNAGALEHLSAPAPAPDPVASRGPSTAQPSPRTEGLGTSGWTDFEREVLRLTNRARARPRSCGSEGRFPAARPLYPEGRLRDAALAHAADMANRGYFSHDTPEGLRPSDRMEAAGFQGWVRVGENIAAGQRDPEAVVAGWLESDAHCANLMSRDYTHLGVGHHQSGEGYRHWWVQNFGAR